MTGSVNIPMFVVSRLIMGFAIGALVTLVPLYQVGIPYPDQAQPPCAHYFSPRYLQLNPEV